MLAHQATKQLVWTPHKLSCQAACRTCQHTQLPNNYKCRIARTNAAAKQLDRLSSKQHSVLHNSGLHFCSQHILHVTVSAPTLASAHTCTHRRVNKHRKLKLLGLTIYTYTTYVCSRVHTAILKTSQDAPKRVCSPAEHTHVQMLI